MVVTAPRCVLLIFNHPPRLNILYVPEVKGVVCDNDIRANNRDLRHTWAIRI